MSTLFSVAERRRGRAAGRAGPRWWARRRVGAAAVVGGRIQDHGGADHACRSALFLLADAAAHLVQRDQVTFFTKVVLRTLGSALLAAVFTTAGALVGR